MAKKLKWSDLFDFSDNAQVQQAIKSLKAIDKVYKDLIKTTKKGSDQIKANQKKLVDSLKGTTEATKKLSEVSKEDAKVIQQQNAQVKALTDSYNAQKKQITTLNAKVKSLSEERKKVAKGTSEVVRLEAQLNKLTGEGAKKTAALKLQIQEKRKALSDEAKVAAGRVTLYQKESKLLNDLRNKYKNVALAQGQNSKAAKQLLAQIIPLDKKLKQLDATVGQGQRSIGRYGAAIVTTGKQFLQAFGIFGGVTLIANLITSTFELIKETERYNKALKQVTRSSFEYEEELGFLINISNRYGLNLNSLTDSYTKFFVATKNTNLEGEETRRIFDAVSKSAAIMALSSDDTEGALKALGQMISKGKVQAEELRGQLGDRLPGAFAIMADALEVTTGELDKMLKDGKLLAVDVLPRFARQLEKTFGLETVTTIDTLQASQTRLTNAWIGFVKSVEDGEGTIAKLVKGFITGTIVAVKLAQQINDIGEGLDFFQDGVETGKSVAEMFEDDLAPAIDKYNKELEIARADQKRWNDLVEGGGDDTSSYADEVKRLEGLLSVLNGKQQKAIAIAKAKEKAEQDARNAAEAARKARLAEFAAREFPETIKLFGQNIKKAEDAIDRFFFEAIFGKQDEIDAGVNKAVASISAGIDKLVQKNKDADAATLKSKQERSEKEAIIRDTAFEGAEIIGNQLFENNRIRLDNELFDLQAQKAFELALAEGNAEQLAAVEAKFAEKEKKLRIKQAKAAKKQALFNIAINTAAAILATLAQNPLPAGLPLLIATAAIGAIQTGAVISQPLPAFEHGGMVETDSKIQTSEKGREMYVGPDGKIGMTGNSGSETRSGMKGSFIIPNKATEALLSSGFDHKAINDESSFKIQSALQREKDRHTNRLVIENKKETDLLIEAFSKTVGGIQITNMNIRRGQMVKDMKKGNTTIRDWENKNGWN